jgi:peptide/nickel transport system substrate-binding protein
MDMSDHQQFDERNEATAADGPRLLSRRMMLRLGLAGGGALVLGPGLLAACSADDSGSGGGATTSGDTGGQTSGGTAPSSGGSSGGSAKKGGTLNIGADADPIGLDPGTTPAFSSFDFTALIYTGLLRWSPEMKPEPDLATSYDTPDDTTYVFHLRKGVKFHNGQDFTADDVKYTFDRILDPKTASSYASTFATIDSVTVGDPQTVTFKLKNPDAAFLSYIATNPTGAIVPKGVTGLESKPVGTGPFVFDAYTPNQQLSLKANPDYYEEGEPYLDTVVFKFFKDQSSLTSALRSKAIDMTWLKDPKVAAQVVKSSPDLVSTPGKTSRTFPVWLNMTKKPLDDVRVRQALSMATDRQACVQTVLAGSGKVGAMIPESQVGGYDGTSPLPNYTHDVEGAKKLLADAGYPDGIDLGDYIVVAANDLDVQCSQILQQQWAEAGNKVNLKPEATAPLLEQWQKGDYTILSVALSWNPDPDAIVTRLLSTNTYGKAMGMKDSEYDDMVAKAREELDLDKRAADYQEIQKRIADQAYCLQVYQYPLRWEMWWNYVKGYVALPANIRSYVRTAWLDK